MNIFERIKTLLNDHLLAQQSGRRQIVISHRSDGLPLMGIPGFVAPWVSNYTKTLKCSDGTNLQIRTTSSLITGVSAHKDQILTRQIASAVCGGYTPIVLSSDGQQGEVFKVLRTIYPESAINYISESVNSGCYNPFGRIPHSYIADFFYQMVMELQQHPANGMLVRNYINVCVKVFFSNDNTISSLLVGQLDHMGLLQEIRHLYQSNDITEQVKVQLENTANSAQSVSVEVFSVIQDYLYKLRRISGSRPEIQIVPHITILDTTQQGLHLNQNISRRTVNEYDMSVINEKKCIFIQMNNEILRDFNNLPNKQCFQWYLAKTIHMDLNAKIEIKTGRILLIVENINSILLKWFWWLIDLPNCVLLLNYEDFYSKMADSQEYRQQLVSKMDRIYFFSVLEEQSASWASRFFGTHTIPKVVVTDQPYRDWRDIIIKPRAYAHDEIEKPWFSTHEIQHLGNSGIVYSKSDKIFTACYRENGTTYEDKKYRGKRVNFCPFSFR